MQTSTGYFGNTSGMRALLYFVILASKRNFRESPEGSVLVLNRRASQLGGWWYELAVLNKTQILQLFNAWIGTSVQRMTIIIVTAPLPSALLGFYFETVTGLFHNTNLQTPSATPRLLVILIVALGRQGGRSHYMQGRCQSCSMHGLSNESSLHTLTSNMLPVRNQVFLILWETTGLHRCLIIECTPPTSVPPPSCAKNRPTFILFRKTNDAIMHDHLTLAIHHECVPSVIISPHWRLFHQSSIRVFIIRARRKQNKAQTGCIRDPHNGPHSGEFCFLYRYNSRLASRLLYDYSWTIVAADLHRSATCRPRTGRPELFMAIRSLLAAFSKLAVGFWGQFFCMSLPCPALIVAMSLPGHLYEYRFKMQPGRMWFTPSSMFTPKNYDKERADTRTFTSWPLGVAAAKLIVLSHLISMSRGKDLTMVDKTLSDGAATARGREVNARVPALPL